MQVGHRQYDIVERGQLGQMLDGVSGEAGCERDISKHGQLEVNRAAGRYRGVHNGDIARLSVLESPRIE